MRWVFVQSVHCLSSPCNPRRQLTSDHTGRAAHPLRASLCHTLARNDGAQAVDRERFPAKMFGRQFIRAARAAAAVPKAQVRFRAEGGSLLTHVSVSAPVQGGRRTSHARARAPRSRLAAAWPIARPSLANSNTPPRAARWSLRCVAAREMRDAASAATPGLVAPRRGRAARRRQRCGGGTRPRTPPPFPPPLESPQARARCGGGAEYSPKLRPWCACACACA